MSVIVVVLPKLEDAKKIRKILLGHGFSRVFACASGALALQEVNRHDCGLVIGAYRLKDLYYRELLESLPAFFEFVLVGSANLVSEAAGETGQGMLCLTTPFKVHDLVNTAGMVMGQLEKRVKRERGSKKRTDQEKNYIRNAKFLLMERNHLTEEEAHRYIQKCSMDNGTNMAETAQMILMLLYDEV